MRHGKPKGYQDRERTHDQMTRARHTSEHISNRPRVEKHFSGVVQIFCRLNLKESIGTIFTSRVTGNSIHTVIFDEAQAMIVTLNILPSRC
jgi:hypothetical protein